MELKELPDHALGEKIEAGEQEAQDAFRELYARWEARVYARAFRILHMREDAEEVAQEVFLAVYKVMMRGGIREDIGRYLMRSTTNASLNLIARRKTAKRAAEDAAVLGVSGTEDPGRDAVARVLRAAVEGLPEKLRVLVVQRYFENMSAQDIADESGRSVRMVNIDLWRVRGRLLSEMQIAGVSSPAERVDIFSGGA